MTRTHTHSSHSIRH